MHDTQAHHNKGKIFIVDDETTNLALLATILTEQGYSVRTETNGIRALELMHEAYLPDVILLEITIPGINGYTVCEQIKADKTTQDIPVIFISTLATAADKVQAFQVGGADYITKPFQIAELLVRVENQLTIQRTKDALRRSEKQFRLLAENARDMIFRYRFTPPRGFEYVSPSVEAIMGYTPEEYYNDPDIDLKSIHPESRTVFAIMGQSPDSYKEQITLRYIRKDGRDVWVEQTHYPILDEAGRTIAIEGIARDITERKRAEEALWTNLQFLETLLDTIPSPVFYKDVQGRFRGYNRLFAQQILGLSDDQVTSHFIYDQTRSSMRSMVDLHKNIDQQLMSNPEAPVSVAKVKCADNIWRDFCLTRATFLDADGKEAGFVCVMLDITDQIQKEQQLRKTNNELKTLNRELKGLNNRMQTELDMARRTQQGLLPAPTPNWNGLDVFCYSRPAREVGGDLYIYNVLEQPGDARHSGTYLIAVGDVAGKGMPAALLMAVSIAAFRSVTNTHISPGHALANLDKVISNHTRNTILNCAMVLAEITINAPSLQKSESKRHYTVRVANAGCVAPLLRHSDGTAEWIDIGGMPLGMEMSPERGYEEKKLIIKTGDMLILTSDGVLETQNTSGEFFSFERLEHAVQSGPSTSAEAMVNYLRTRLEGFCGDRELHDDLTIIVLRVD